MGNTNTTLSDRSFSFQASKQDEPAFSEQSFDRLAKSTAYQLRLNKDVSLLGEGKLVSQMAGKFFRDEFISANDCLQANATVRNWKHDAKKRVVNVLVDIQCQLANPLDADACKDLLARTLKEEADLAARLNQLEELRQFINPDKQAAKEIGLSTAAAGAVLQVVTNSGGYAEGVAVHAQAADKIMSQRPGFVSLRKAVISSLKRLSKTYIHAQEVRRRVAERLRRLFVEIEQKKSPLS